MSVAERLYTPELLSLAVRLASYPWQDELALQGDARSKSCGSTLKLGLTLDESGVINRIGMRVRACAIGQASAAIFADSAIGRDREAIRSAHTAMLQWLSGEGPLPSWPRIEAIEPALAYPARHGAMMLPWEAAVAAFSIPSMID